MTISTDPRDTTAREETARSYPVLSINDYRFEQSVLRPLARTLGLTQLSCPKVSGEFGEHLLDQLCVSPRSLGKFSEYVAGRQEESSRIALRSLLDQDYQDGVRSRHQAAGPDTSNDPYVILSRASHQFANGVTSPELWSLFLRSDLSRVVFPVIDTLINDTHGYLTRRIPPHVGHGASRLLCFAKPEVIEAHKEDEARQDRGAACALLKRLKDLIVSGDPKEFTLFMQTFNTCGEWLSWLTHAPEAQSPHPEAEQIVANTIVRLLMFKDFTQTYESQFMTPCRTASLARWQWCEPSRETNQLDPFAYPLMASALAILTQAEFKHL